jgi:hypothetical protein
MSAVAVFQLAVDKKEIYDGSTKGIGIQGRGNVRLNYPTQSVNFSGGVIQATRHKELENLSSFTIDVILNPQKIGGGRQTIIDAESPGIALYIQPDGRLTGSVHTEQGWQSVTSPAPLKVNTEISVHFTRSTRGLIKLKVGNTAEVSAKSPGKLQPIGQQNLTIGAAADGQKDFFTGSLRGLSISQGTVSASYLDTLNAKATKMQQDFIVVSGMTRVEVFPPT